MDDEHERAFEKLTRRDASDYNELLRWGSVRRRAEDVERWRDEIRAKARADKRKVRTGGYDDGVVWAVLVDREVSREYMRGAEAHGGSGRGQGPRGASGSRDQGVAQSR